MFYIICKFESSATTNAVIMTSLPKTIANIRNVLMRAFQKMYFLLNLCHCVKSYGHYCQILAFFYDARSPDMVMSSDPRSKFQKVLFCPNSRFNIRKSHKISSGNTGKKLIKTIPKPYVGFVMVFSEKPAKNHHFSQNHMMTCQKFWF